MPFLKGEAKKNPRQGLHLFDDDGDLIALRLDDWKFVFMEQRAQGLSVWAEPFMPLRLPNFFNLRTDPFERADMTSNFFYDWILYHSFMVLAAQTIVGRVSGDV